MGKPVSGNPSLSADQKPLQSGFIRLRMSQAKLGRNEGTDEGDREAIGFWSKPSPKGKARS